MHVRIAALAATLFVAGCANQASTRAPATTQSTASRSARSIERENAMLASLRPELRVRLNQDLGAVASPMKDTFTARLIAPVVGPNGQVLVPVGSLVWGHVVHVDDTTRRVEIAFDKLETRSAVYRLSATVLNADPYAVTVRPAGAPIAETVILQGNAPSAIGGGPPAPESESDDESAPRGEVIVPFDAEMRLQLNAPLVATSAG